MQVVPHITDAVQSWITKVSAIPVDEANIPSDVCIVEVSLGNFRSFPCVDPLANCDLILIM